MPNKHYVSGRRKEWKVQEILESEGYATFRTAGSHTPVDVLAFWQKTEKSWPLATPYPVWVQVKSSTPMSNDEWNVLFLNAHSCGALPILAECLPRKPIKFYVLLGTRAKNSHVKPWTEWQP